MKVTAGVFIINEYNKYLIVHPTGDFGDWSVPKGVIDEGETPEQAARREVLEETGIDLSGVALKDLGRHSYRYGKDIHLFVAKIDNSRSLKLVCSSTFENSRGEHLPEIDRFEWLDWNQMMKTVNRTQFEILAQSILNDRLGV